MRKDRIDICACSQPQSLSEDFYCPSTGSRYLKSSEIPQHVQSLTKTHYCSSWKSLRLSADDEGGGGDDLGTCDPGWHLMSGPFRGKNVPAGF